MRLVFPVIAFLASHVLTRRTPMGRKALNEVRFHGGPKIRVKRSDLHDRGVERVLDRVTGVRAGLPMLAGGRSLDVANVVWCTGFRQVFDWIDLPIFGGRRLATGAARRGARGSGAVLQWAGVPVRVQFDGAVRCWQRCRLCRRADQSPSRRVIGARSLSMCMALHRKLLQARAAAVIARNL